MERGKSDQPATEDEARSAWWEDIRDHYLTIDRRTLGLARLFIGFFLIFDLFRRTADWQKMYGEDGVLPAHFNLFRPQANGWTFFNGFSEGAELWALWAIGLAIFTCYFVGYRTKTAQILAAIYVASMNGRVLLIENGGYVVQNLLLLWTAFLPLGDRFSLDALRASLRTQRERSEVDLNDRRLDTAHWRLEPAVSLASLAILLQLAAIYFFNVVHKTGPNWSNGHAVHHVMYVDRMVNPLFGVVREHQPYWVDFILTKIVLASEAGLPIAILSPLGRVWSKRLVIVFINFLHIGFGSVFTLGPFAWALCCFSILLISPEDWELVIRTMRRSHRRRTVRYPADSAWAFFLCRLLKRCDHFELLRFRAHGGAFQVETPDGERRNGIDAARDVCAALPGGPPLAPLLGLPGVWPLAALPWGRFFGFGAREEPTHPRPVGYRPEPEDGAPLDGAKAVRWLRDRYGRRRYSVYLGLAGVVAVPLLGVYGLAALPRAVAGAPLLAGWTVRQVVFWGGVALTMLGVGAGLRPLWRMNAEIASSLSTKARRIGAGAREAFV
ncbi:MAG: hypothetical protein AAGA56_12725, partial [Myxococcota bacterium]